MAAVTVSRRTRRFSRRSCGGCKPTWSAWEPSSTRSASVAMRTATVEGGMQQEVASTPTTWCTRSAWRSQAVITAQCS
eukprot:3489860-Heterocapsa_arctica.AAC.1